MVKLTDKKIRWIVRHAGKDVSVGGAAKIYGVSDRRIQQLVKSYRETGEIPKLKRNRRPKTHLAEEQRQEIELAWQETRLGARLLYHHLKSRNQRIPHNKINSYLKATGRTIPNPNKQKKRKRCRYERDHSGSLLHGDWHRTTIDHPHAIAWLDDASRYILSSGEFQSATGKYSIETFKAAQAKAGEHNLIVREVNTDRGSQFYGNKNDGVTEFQRYLESQGIRHIPSKVKNPQTNGKLERFWYEYDRHRWRFETFTEFASWYNRRIHGALWLEIGETPEWAFQRKMPPESMLGLFSKLNGW